MRAKAPKVEAPKGMRGPMKQIPASVRPSRPKARQQGVGFLDAIPHAQHATLSLLAKLKLEPGAKLGPRSLMSLRCKAIFLVAVDHPAKSLTV